MSSDMPRTFTLRSCVLGICAMVLMGIWIQFHEVLATPANILAENNPPAAAVGIFLGVLVVAWLITRFARRLALAKSELLVVYAMLVISAPLMSQGMWHRFLGLVVSIPRAKENFTLVDSYSDALWPHGPQLIRDRRFRDGLGPEVVADPAERVRLIASERSPVGPVAALELWHDEDAAGGAELVETTLRLRVPRRNERGREGLVPGERYYLTALFRLRDMESRSFLSVDLESDGGTRIPVTVLRRDTNEAYSRPGAFVRAGEPSVVLPRDVREHVDIVFTLTGAGAAAFTDVKFFSNAAVERMHKGSAEIAADDLPRLPDAQRDGLLVRPRRLGGPAGLWYVFKGYIPWSQWARPLLYWSSIVMAMFLCLLGIGVIFRKQWAEIERFSFPMVVLPRLLLEEREEGGVRVRPIFRHPAFRIGVGAALLYCLLLGLAYYLPGMPRPAVNVNLVEYVKSPAMKSFMAGMSSGNFQILLLFTAIAFFVELDMLLSIILFLWVCKIPYYLGEVFGWKTIKGPLDNFPFPHEQHIGAFLCLALVVLWVSRKHLLGVARRVLGRPGGTDDSREAMSYRAATLLIVACLFFFALWGELTGLGWGSALTFFGFLVVCGLSASRIRTECGAPATYFTPYFPYLIFFILGGLRVFGTQTMILTYAAGGFMAVAQFLLFAPSQVEMLHLAHSEGASPRGVKWGLILGGLGGILIGGYVLMVWCYGVGGDNIPYMKDWGIGQNWYFTSLRNAVNELDAATVHAAKSGEAVATSYPMGPVAGVGAGIFVTLLLTALRTYFVGFWLHPIGYVLANTYFIGMCWGSLFTAWIIKWVALKVGGPRLIRERMTPLFAGLFVGAVLGMLVWDGIALVRLGAGLRDIYVCLP
jgi:hypothetical protein